jgi:predicted 3-demethylubiquinone-9 3-methyltransferase (glyoxalase superfamily)
MSQKITPFLWFDGNAEEAAHYYVSIFKNSRITDIAHYTGAEPGPKGTVMTIGFELDGQRFAGINGGPLFKFTEAVSFAVRCKDQAEIDAMWEKLSAGGEKGPCGWLKDRFGLSWQVVPEFLIEVLGKGDTEKSARVMAAVMKMSKLDLATLKAAAAG